MATDQDLMGFGLNALLASRLADCASTINITPAASGSSYATSTIIQGNQFLTYSTSATGGWLGIPAIGGSDNAARIADGFIFMNIGAGAVTLAVVNNTVTLWVAGTATSQTTVAKGHTLSFWPVSINHWASILG